jgi:TonB family protein
MRVGATNPILERQMPESGFVLARAEQEGFLRHFGFRESPFGVTPDPEFLFWTRIHNAALQSIISSIESNLGFSVLLGNPGTGKTSLLFHLLAQYRESARTAFIFQTQCKPHDLIRHIASELDLAVPRRDEVSLHQKLNGMLLDEARAGRKVLIVIDEAQNLQASSFEAVRLLSDFETSHSKLLNIVFSGSPQLGATLQTPELSQLAQRISTVARLQPFREDEVKDYVRFRLAVVASNPVEGLFSSESLAEIACRSEGVPRIINAICYRALMLAYTQGQASVSRELVWKAAKDLDLSEPGSRDSSAALQFQKFESAPHSNGGPGSIATRSEQSQKPPAQTFVETVPLPSFDAKSFAPTSQSPSAVKHDESGWRGQPVPAKADQRARIGVPAIIPAIMRFKTAGWHRYRSTTVIAALVLLACASWVGWNQLRAKPGTSEKDSIQRQAQLPTSAIKMDEIQNGVPESSVQQPNRVATALPLTNSNTHQSAGDQFQPSTDVGPNLLIPSKIPSQSATPVEPSSPNIAVSMPRPSDNLARLATAGLAASPRFEAGEVAGSSGPRVSFSLHPVKIVEPEYPARAKLWHIEGEVQVELTIDRNGSVRRAHALSGNATLAQAAEEAARQWKYAPYTGNDQIAFPAVTRVQFNFKFNSGTETKK